MEDRMITGEPYEIEGERFVKLASELGSIMDVTADEYAQLAATTSRPGRGLMVGYRLRDYDHAIATLAESRRSRALTLATVAGRLGWRPNQVSALLRGYHEARGSRFFALADALGYDLALVPRRDA
jgi:hypothetical protein